MVRDGEHRLDVRQVDLSVHRLTARLSGHRWFVYHAAGVPLPKVTPTVRRPIRRLVVNFLKLRYIGHGALSCGAGPTCTYMYEMTG